MVGRNPLLVAKEHGHRPTTMLSVYAAWTEGSAYRGGLGLETSELGAGASECPASSDLISGSLAASDERARLSSPPAISRSRMA